MKRLCRTAVSAWLRKSALLHFRASPRKEEKDRYAVLPVGRAVTPFFRRSRSSHLKGEGHTPVGNAR